MQLNVALEARKTQKGMHYSTEVKTVLSGDHINHFITDALFYFQFQKNVNSKTANQPKPALIFAHEHEFLPSSPKQFFCPLLFQKDLGMIDQSESVLFAYIWCFFRGQQKKTFSHLSEIYPVSTRWLPRDLHVVVFKTKVPHFKVKNTPLKGTSGKRKLNRMLTLQNVPHPQPNRLCSANFTCVTGSMIQMVLHELL